MSRRRNRKASKKQRAPETRREWIGGRRTLPIYVEQPQPFRPEIILWLEMPEELVVGSAMLDPDQSPVSMGESFLETARAPLTGEPRRPARVRIDDAALATELRVCVPNLDVVVRPTPELDRLVELMTESMTDDDFEPSYLEGGQVSEDVVKRFFVAAEQFYATAPWEIAEDMEPVGVDIPALEVERACVSIIGAQEESFGFVLLSSLRDFDTFIQTTAGFDETGDPAFCEVPLLSLNFDRGGDIPDSLRREILDHGWPVAAADAYPTIIGTDRQGMPRPLSERDYRIVSACASALGDFVTRHAGLFHDLEIEPVKESVTLEAGLTVQLSLPCEFDDLLRTDALAADATDPAGSPVHAMDKRLTNQMVRYAAHEFGEQWLDAVDLFEDDDSSMQLMLSWAIYHQKLDKKPLVHWFLRAEGSRLEAEERRWLKAQQTAWLSLWEVTAVGWGRELELHDLLSDEQRLVREVTASKTLRIRDVILARIVTHDGESLLCGSHPQPLPPSAADDVARRVRSRLRKRRVIPVARLRDEKLGRYLITRWDEAAWELEDRLSRLPDLHNTEGHPVLLSVDHFDIKDGPAIERILDRLDGVIPPDDNDHEPIWHLLDPEADILIGTVAVTGTRLTLETNSVERANVLRGRLEAACGDRIRHRAREHSDPFALLEHDDDAPVVSSLPPEEVTQLMLDFKTGHYADWADQPWPALGGATPREAIRTNDAETVDLLLKDMEHAEAGLPEAQRFDFSVLRRKLGLGS